MHQRQKWHPPSLRPNAHIRLPCPAHPRGTASALFCNTPVFLPGEGRHLFAPCAIISIPNRRLRSPAPLGDFARQEKECGCNTQCRHCLPYLRPERAISVSSAFGNSFSTRASAAEVVSTLPATQRVYLTSMPSPSARYSQCAFCNTPVFLLGEGGVRSIARPLPPDFSAFHERPAGTESSRRGAMRVTACEPSAPAPYPRRYSPFPSADRGCGRFPSSSFLFSPARGRLPARPLRRCFPLPSA